MFFIILLNTLLTYMICSFIGMLCVFYIIFFALIILNSEVLSLFGAFNIQNVSILAIIETISLYILFVKTKTQPYFPDIKEELMKIKNSFKLDKLLFSTLFFFCFMMISFFILSIYSPPLEPDCRMYHFVRIFSYIKQHSFSHFDTSQIRNVVMPFNSEVIYSYFYLFKRNFQTADLGFGFVSYFSFINAIFQIYLILRHFKFSIRKILFAVFILSSMGAIAVQIPSLQTDIVIASLILSSFYLLLKFSCDNNSNKSNTILFLSSLAYALAIGTKTTAIIMFPSYLIILFFVVKNKKAIFKYSLFFLINFLIFSSYNYILNFIQFHDFISPISLKAEHAVINGIKEYFLNLIFFIKDFIESKILYLLSLGKNITAFILYDERKIGFSLLGCLVFIPMLFYSIFKGLCSKNKKAKFISLCSILFFLNFIITCLSFTYSPYIIRYFVTFVMVSCFGIIYFYKFRILKNIVLVLCIFEMLFYSINSGRYPIHFLSGSFDKDKIMLKQQRDLADYIQYKFLKNFLEIFKKEDKILVLDDVDFYEIKQLMNFGYNIDVAILDNIDKELLDKYDFFVFRYYSEFCDDINYFDIENQRFKCEYSIKPYKNKMIPMAKKCSFDAKFLNDRGFYFDKKIQIEDKNFYVYKNSQK